MTPAPEDAVADAFLIVTTLRAHRPEVASVAIALEHDETPVLYYETERRTTLGIIRRAPAPEHGISAHAAMIVVPAAARLAALLAAATAPLSVERASALRLGLRIGWNDASLRRRPADDTPPPPDFVMTLSQVPGGGGAPAIRNHSCEALANALGVLRRIAAIAAAAPQCLFSNRAEARWLVRLDCGGIGEIEVPADDPTTAAAAAAAVALLAGHQVGQLPHPSRVRLLRVDRLEAVADIGAAQIRLGDYWNACASLMGPQD